MIILLRPLLLHSFLFLVLASLFYAYPAHAQDTGQFPIVVRGVSFSVSKDSDYQTIQKQLGGLLSADELSVALAYRIQYDFIAVEGQAPVLLLFDFDKRGRWTTLVVEANMKKQNPVARELGEWLVKNAGPGKKSGKTTTWSHAGFTFRLREVINAGENSVYGMTVTRK